MNHQAALHETLQSLLRDERLAPTWVPLVVPLRRILDGDDEDFADAVHELGRTAAVRGEPHISDLLSFLEAGFARLAEPHSEPELAGRLADLSSMSVRCVAIGYAVGLEEKLTALQELIDEASPLDPDTGVLRPRDLREHLSMEINRCQRMQLPMGVAVFFNRGTDAGGPAETPALAVGRVLRENLRRYDELGRLETGEYVAVLPDVSRIGLGAAAERLHSQLAEDPRTTAAPRCMALTHLDCVDVSVGDLIEQVEEALQHARAGDDYICWA
jgi:GGDEF domain-containing protein